MRVRICLLLGLMLVWASPAICVNALIHDWSQRFGDAEQQHARSLAVDNSGNVIVTGPFYGTVDFGCGELTSAGFQDDIYLAKFDAVGSCLWSKRFGDGNRQGGAGVAVDSLENVIVTGSFQGIVDFGGGELTSAGELDIFVAKFDAEGNHLWSQRFGDDSWQYSEGIAVDGLGNVIVTGAFWGTLDFRDTAYTSVGRTDIFVVKFNPSGTPMWSHCFGDTGSDWGQSVVVDGSGNIVLGAVFKGTFDLGDTTHTSAGGDDILIVKFDEAGDRLWSHSFGDVNSQAVQRVAVDGSENVIITGPFTGTVDFGGTILTSVGSNDIYVAKFDAAGNHLWSQRFGDADSQIPQVTSFDGSGNVILAGHFAGTVDFGGGALTSAGDYDIFIARFDAAGGHLWSQRFGDANIQLMLDAMFDNWGNVFVTGYFDGTVDFGGGALTSSGDMDIYLAKFRPSVQPLVRPRGEWRYTSEDPGTCGACPDGSCWLCLGFDDSSWQTGHSPFGNTCDLTFGCQNDCPVSVYCTYWPPCDSLWLRKTFLVDEPDDWNLYYGVDNSATFYLNGMEILDVEFDGFDYRWYSIALPSTFFVEGENVIAVQLRDTDCYLNTLTAFDLFIGKDLVTGIRYIQRENILPSARLYPNFPNPFNPTTIIRYELAERMKVSLRIYDVSGRLVRTLVAPTWMGVGEHLESWDSLQESGDRVSSGVYFYRLRAGNTTITKKMVLIK